MTGESRDGRSGARRWLPLAAFAVAMAATFGLGMLVVTVMERRWETSRPALVVAEIGEWESDNSVWGRNYPREYETFLMTRTPDTRTAFGGSWKRDYLEEDPRQVVLFAGYLFSKDYSQARGHALAVEDILATRRTTRADGTDTGQPGTCWTCKSPDAPRLMQKMGIEGFYHSKWVDLKAEVKNPIGCLDCHDPRTMNLRVSRPALREAFARQGRDIDQATHQEMRSLVCAQCHVEYYFGNDPAENEGKAVTFGDKGKYLVFPWDEGTTADSFEAYYAKRAGFSDWTHPISGTRMVKMQHPDWEVYSSGVHAYRSVACADCHMPYRTEGGVKFSSHHVASPLLDVSTSCGVCHRWSEAEVESRVEAMQGKQWALRLQAEDALVRAHFDVAAAKEAGAGDEELAGARDLVRRAQMRWDYVSANNGMGFHSPAECLLVLATAIDLAQEARLLATRILAVHGVTGSPVYPDVSTRQKALEVITAFEKAAADPAMKPPSLLPEGWAAQAAGPQPAPAAAPAAAPPAPSTAPAGVPSKTDGTAAPASISPGAPM